MPFDCSYELWRVYYNIIKLLTTFVYDRIVKTIKLGTQIVKTIVRVYYIRQPATELYRFRVKYNKCVFCRNNICRILYGRFQHAFIGTKSRTYMSSKNRRRDIGILYFIITVYTCMLNGYSYINIYIIHTSI